MKGFISLHRKLMDNPIWSDPNYLKLWIYCLFEASHKDREQLVGNKIVSLERGQFVTGRFSLAEEMNKGVKPKQRLNERTWWRHLENFEKWGMLSIKSTNKYSIVTIDNYDVYQKVFSSNAQQTDQQLSNKSPTTDQQMSTNNNVNNLNNVNNNTSTTTTSRDDAIVFFQNNFGVTSPFEQDSILAWIKDMGEEMVLEAMKRAIKRGKKNWGYTEKILKDWLSKNIRTLDQAKAEEVAFQNQQASRRSYQPRQQENVPEWFKNRNKQSNKVPNDPEATEEDLAAILAKYKTKTAGSS